MDQFIKAIEQSISNENWYSALFVALSIPDICGKLESPKTKSTDRYINWIRRYLTPKYISDKDQYEFLRPSDCYALRCAFLHEGRDQIDEQRCREVLQRFRFVKPRPGLIVHCNIKNEVVLQLQVDIFCRDICDGVRQWLNNIVNNADIQARMTEMMKIESFNDVISL